MAQQHWVETPWMRRQVFGPDYRRYVMRSMFGWGLGFAIASVVYILILVAQGQVAKWGQNQTLFLLFVMLLGMVTRVAMELFTRMASIDSEHLLVYHFLYMRIWRISRHRRIQLVRVGDTVSRLELSRLGQDRPFLLIGVPGPVAERIAQLLEERQGGGLSLR